MWGEDHLLLSSEDKMQQHAKMQQRTSCHPKMQQRTFSLWRREDVRTSSLWR